MPLLAAPGFGMSFEAVSKADQIMLPESVRPAAELIKQWHEGRDSFELKTSGSTGEPKTIRLKRHLIVHSARLTQQAFRLEKGDRLLCALSTEHIAGFMMVMRALVVDCDLYPVPPASNPFADIPEEQKTDFASFVPLQMQTVLKEGMGSRLDELKVILLGGAPVSESLIKEIKKLQVPVYQGYGMTETYTHVALRKLNGSDASAEYKALPGVAISQDKRGCLCIRSEVTENKWLATNDIVALHATGSFTWIGRWDNVINTGGVKVQAEKVEQAIESVFGENKRPFFVTGLPDEELGEKIVLVLEDEPWKEEEKSVLLTRLSDALSKYELPKELYFEKTFDRTALGKVDKRKILDRIKTNALK